MAYIPKLQLDRIIECVSLGFIPHYQKCDKDKLNDKIFWNKYDEYKLTSSDKRKKELSYELKWYFPDIEIRQKYKKFPFVIFYDCAEFIFYLQGDFVIYSYQKIKKYDKKALIGFLVSHNIKSPYDQELLGSKDQISKLLELFEFTTSVYDYSWEESKLESKEYYCTEEKLKDALRWYMCRDDDIFKELIKYYEDKQLIYQEGI